MSIVHWSSLRSLPLLLGLAIVPWVAGAQTRHEIVRGRVTSDSGKAIEGADVIAIRAPDRTSKSARTGVDGQYSIDWPDGTGDYLVRIGLIGYAPFTKRVQRAGADSVFVVDATLSREGAAQKLATVVSRARQQKPDRNPPGGVDVGGAEAMPGNYRRVPPDQAGDLAATARLAPGVLATGGGISVLGLDPGQNSTTLNGMAFPGAVIPRDLNSRLRVSTATYDPANGWFSGARTNVQISQVTELFTRRDAHLTMDAPALQANDPIAARIGQRYTNLNGSVGGSGPLGDDHFAYNYGLQAYRRSADVASLVDAGASLLAHAGVSADSSARLLDLLQGARIPTGTKGIPSSAITDNVVFLGRIDHAPYDWATLTPARTTWGLTGYANLTRNQAQNISPTGTPAHGGETSQALASAQAEYSTYFGNDYLADVRTGLSVLHNGGDPYLSLPDGQVLVSSALPNGGSGVSTLLFGGNGAMRRSSNAWTWESIGELQFYPPSFARHRVKLTADVRLDGVSQDVPGNSLGTFTYSSLADLAANRPASFSRALASPPRQSGAWNGFVAIGDLWRVNSSLQVLYGLRAEGNVFTEVPAFNPAVETAFGARTDRAPNDFALLPRLGFTWNHAGHRGSPTGTVRGGIGAFRNLLDPSLLSAASVATGLPGAQSRISCIGSGVPAPDWSAFAAGATSIPRQCANGTTATFSDGAPNVQLFDPSYSPSTSWRGNLSWSSGLWGRTAYTIEGVYSENLSQASALDLNFSGAPRFTLPDEGRPMFVSASSIVPSSGAVSPVDARLSPAFGRVVRGVSDTRSNSRQLLLSMRPDLGKVIGPVVHDPMIGYVLSNSRGEQRGFTGTTFGDPRRTAWGSGDLDVRHQFVAQAIIWPMGTRPGPGFFFYGHLQSGLPFTPMVSNDVNGDGLANDRAFVFDPAHTSDTLLAGATRALLTSPDATVHDCLTRQLGRAAGRNSCRGPWSAALNLNVIVPGDLLGPRFKRFDFGLNFTNPLGGLDQLVHGTGGLRGWGAPAAPDPVLYTVRGYDASTNQFRYEVNPRFGTTLPSSNTIRAPFRATLDVTMDVGPSFPAQQVSRWLAPGRRGHLGQKLSVDDLVKRNQRTVPDPYAPLLAQSDSLLLTKQQVAAVQALAAHHRAKLDSLFTRLSEYLAALPDQYDAGEAAKRADDTQDEALEITRVEVREQLQKILSPAQLALLPGLTRYFYNAARPVHERFFIP